MKTIQKLEDHIDDPIKKSVVGMSLLGFETVFSCCGFDYKAEKVTKTHLIGKPYMYLKTNMLVSQKLLLFEIARQSQWTIRFLSDEFIDFYGHNWPENHPWDIKGSPHRPEMGVLSLDALERAIEKQRESFIKDPVTIVDGNYIYKVLKGLKHWQYDPCDPWTVDIQTYERL